MKFIKTFLIILLTTNSLYAQPTKQQLRNLTAFTKLYGYISYFHPSDEAQRIFWARLAIAGTIKVTQAKNDTELLHILRHYFEPIAPSAKFFRTAEKLSFSTNELIPEDKRGFEPVYWQHLGMYLMNSPAYASIRINRKSRIPQPYFGDLDTIPLNPPLDLHDYAGKRFYLTFEMENKTPASPNAILIQPQYGLESTEGFSSDTLKPGEKKVIRLTGTLSKSGSTVFQILINLRMKQKLDIRKGRLEILNLPSPISVSLDSVPKKWLNSFSIDKKSERYSWKIDNAIDDSLFNRKLRIGEHIQQEIVPGISCIIPLVLYGNNVSTFPRGDTMRLENLIKEIDRDCMALKRSHQSLTANLLPVRLANIIIAWNVLQHAFPYWQDAYSSSNAVLQNALKKCFLDKTPDDFFITLKLMSAPLNDGHMFITNDSDSLHRGEVPLIVSSVNDKVIIKKVLSDILKVLFKPGDIILSIDKVPALKFLKTQEALLSGSPQWKRVIALTTFFQGPLNSEVSITISRNGRRKDILTKRSFLYVGHINGTAAYDHKAGWIKPGIFYFDLTKDTLNYNPAQMDNFKEAKTIIFDLRGYPGCPESDENIIPLLLKKQENENRMFNPQIVYPNFKNVTYDDKSFVLKPQGQNLKANIIFLTDASAQSASETILGRVKDFKLGTIVGQQTSGTNGNLNTIFLVGGFSFSYSGMLVKNNDGSRHHLIGVLPDFYANETQHGIKLGIDEVLNKAIAIAERQ